MAVTGQLAKANAAALYDMIQDGTALTAAQLATNDYIGIADVSAGEGKKITIDNLIKARKRNFSLGQIVTLDSKDWIVIHIENNQQDVFLMERYVRTFSTIEQTRSQLDSTLSASFKQDLISYDSTKYSFYPTATNCIGDFRTILNMNGSSTIVNSYQNYGPYGNKFFDYLIANQTNRRGTFSNGSASGYILYTDVQVGGVVTVAMVEDNGSVRRLNSYSSLGAARLCVHYNNGIFPIF